MQIIVEVLLYILFIPVIIFSLMLVGIVVCPAIVGAIEILDFCCRLVATACEELMNWLTSKKNKV